LGNTEKYNSYKVAWERMESSIEQGFFLEAVAIQESMMFDRIRSFVEYSEQSSIPDELPFGVLVKRWEAELNVDKKRRPPIFESADDLIIKVRAWTDVRNSVVHKIVKSRPGDPTIPVDEFLDFAQRAANDGKFLCRGISDWHRKQKALTSALAAHSDE
jgi:hypothetical protein